MVSQLLSPSEPKNLGDILVLFILLLHIILTWSLPSAYRTPVLGAIFLTWRAGYNIGIGWLLHMQSHHNRLVRWGRKSKLFPSASNGENPHPKLRAFVKRELETKIAKDYNFDDAPLEYNTWLVFRRIVDLILMCDFTSYMLFAISCARSPPEVIVHDRPALDFWYLSLRLQSLGQAGRTPCSQGLCLVLG